MMVHPTAAAVGGTSDMKATPSLCPRESPYSPSIISVMTLPGRGADLWVGWLSILRLVHQRSHDMSFQHIIHVTTYRSCYTSIAAISSDTYPSLIVIVRFLQLFSASGGNIPSWNTIASLHPVGMYSLPKLYRFVVISSPGHWFWPYPLINRRFGWYSTRKCEWLDCRRVYTMDIYRLCNMCLYDMFFWTYDMPEVASGRRMIEET